VLKETANRLLTDLRDSDLAARVGGDEFTLILPDTDADAAEIVAKKVLQHLLKPYTLNEQQFILGASNGINSMGDIAPNSV
jgi:diguanylate cyclase (GGDEF)-like protein